MQANPKAKEPAGNSHYHAAKAEKCLSEARLGDMRFGVNSAVA